MKELVKPNRAEARYDEAEGFLAIRIRCGVDNSCEERNRCNSGNSSDAEVMDEILF